MDLLDTTTVSVVGLLRWLDLQQQQMTDPLDKVLVLCSPGVQAKWRAMCGHGRVTLREDVLSPAGDVFIPFLHRFLPDVHHTAVLGKYLVAHFSDVCSEDDVPSLFAVALKYKLMKQFEELYFHILDVEKYQPGEIKHIPGIGGDEYFNCPSGRDLKDAIDTFHAFQLQNPGWFQHQCVSGDDQVLTEAEQLEQQQVTPVLECLPLLADGPPVCSQAVEVAADGRGVHVVTPELRPELRPERQLSASEVVAEPRTPPGLQSVLVTPPPGRVLLSAVEEEEEDQLLDMELGEGGSLLEPAKRPNSGSDQGYVSKTSFNHHPPVEEDPLEVLARLQEELLHNHL